MLWRNNNSNTTTVPADDTGAVALDQRVDSNSGAAITAADATIHDTDPNLNPHDHDYIVSNKITGNCANKKAETVVNLDTDHSQVGNDTVTGVSISGENAGDFGSRNSASDTTVAYFAGLVSGAMYSSGWMTASVPQDNGGTTGRARYETVRDQRDRYLLERNDAEQDRDEWKKAYSDMKTQFVALHGDYDIVIRSHRALEDDLENTKAKADRMVSDAMSRVDRFQATTDVEIAHSMQALQDNVLQLCKLLAKNKQSGLSPEEWGSVIERFIGARHLHPGHYSFAQDLDVTVRKKVLVLSVWLLLERCLFRNPFAGFGRTYRRAAELFMQLFPQQCTDEKSTKWRTATVEKLKETITEEELNNVHDELLLAFKTKLLQPLDYSPTDGMKIKLRGIIVQAVKHAHLLASQRAVYSHWFPNPLEAEHRPEARETTSVDNAFDEVDEEYGGIWFVVKPALIKYGSNMGDKLDEETVVTKAYVQIIPVE